MRSVEDVIDAIGGNSAAASLARVAKSAVSNWKSDGKIPSRYFLLFSRELKELGKGEAPRGVFGFREAAE